MLKPAVNLSSPSHAQSNLPVKLALPVLLLVLLMTQAASTVCGAQCVQHQLPNPSAHAMAHCHAMPQPEQSGAVLQTCQAGTHAFCAIELMANSQGKTASPLVLYSLDRPAALLPDQNIPQYLSASRLLRSSKASSPLITALRV
jgi:hypothetical protein